MRMFPYLKFDKCHWRASLGEQLQSTKPRTPVSALHWLAGRHQRKGGARFSFLRLARLKPIPHCQAMTTN